MEVARANALCPATSSYHNGSSNQKMSSGSASAQKRLHVGRSQRPLPSTAIVGPAPTARRTLASRSRSAFTSSCPTFSFSL